MVDGAVVGQQQTRRTRAAPKVQAYSEAEALAALPQWDPSVEARKMARQREAEARWENSQPATLPGQAQQGQGGAGADGSNNPGRRKVEGAPDNTSFSFGWEGEAARSAAATRAMGPTDLSSLGGGSTAPWEQESADDAATARGGRKAVDGARDMNASRITWRGYGVNDPQAAMSEPLGMAAHDDDPFAIGNPRAENVILRKGRSTRVNQPTGGKASLDLADDAYAGVNEAHRPSRVTNNKVAKSSMGFDNGALNAELPAHHPSRRQGQEPVVNEVGEGAIRGRGAPTPSCCHCHCHRRHRRRRRRRCCHAVATRGRVLTVAGATTHRTTARPLPTD